MSWKFHERPTYFWHMLVHSAPTRLSHCAWAVLVALSLATTAPAQTGSRTAERGTQAGMAKGGGPALWPVDILHQRITLDLTLGNIIAGSCTITGVPRTDGSDHFPLDLLALTVDSVTDALGQMVFTHVGEVLDITLDAPLTTQDTIVLTVYYHGDPALDASGFG